MAAIESFEDVRGLGDAELRALLEGGRPEQRVWAIWALALRSADVGALGERVEPDAGVRRNLAIVLAGHGQLDLLVALAKRDPAAEVRAAAMQLVSRFAIDGKLPQALVRERVGSDGSEVRIAVLGTVFPGAPAWLVELSQKLLDDGDSDVRYEAFEALVRVGSNEHALMWIEEAPEAEARLALMRWSARGRVRASAELLARASRRMRRLLIESVRVASWQDLAPAIGEETQLIRALARRNPNVFDEMPLAALIRATLREPNDSWLALIRDRLARLEAPEDHEVTHLIHDFRELCADRVVALGKAISELRKQRDEDMEHEIAILEDQRVVIESALDHAARMLVH
jgi:HEAT repeat protein